MSTQRELTPEQLKRRAKQYALELRQRGASRYEIEGLLVDEGLDQQTARQIYRDVEYEQTQLVRRTQRKIAQRDMAIGGVVCVIGIIISVASYNAAASSPTGGSYVVTWGAVAFGGFQFVKGLVKYLEG